MNRMLFCCVALLSIAVVLCMHVTPAHSQLQGLIKRFYMSQSQKDCAGFASLFDDAFTITDPAGTPPTTNKTALVANCKQGGQMFARIIMFPTQVFEIVQGTQAAVNFQVNSVVNATTGCSLDFGGVDVFELDATSGLLKTVTGFYNVSIPGGQMAKCMQ